LRVLILYTELAGYVLGNINRFLESYPGAEALIVHYPVNPEAPFNFSTFESIGFIDKSTVSEEIILSRSLEFDPDVVLCSGWANAVYLDIVKQLPAKVKKVVCLDNQWKGTLKQRLLVLASPFWLLKLFKYAWVPGEPQKKYALRLGFRKQNIYTGLYPADSDLYSSIGKKKLEAKGKYPRQFISIARYIPQKDLPTLWNAFILANGKSGHQWTLKCFGFGELFDSRAQDAHIFHMGFKQPYEMEKYILEAGVYVLPSNYEPWGVAVHEMTLSALPVVLSDKVGAGSMFLSSGNGFVFESGDVHGLETILLKIMRMPDEELWTMAEESYRCGLKLTSGHWSVTLREIIGN
jgi:glycosyltransferase involved in cell wall biosynthesis